ncbi:hypothetical protein BJ165DRAFT_1592538 [Panaeolus papilionaceus]|nr:hypothetical protein BJ165DRAFT_1592538 [Panaeolus papilionaceus]
MPNHPRYKKRLRIQGLPAVIKLDIGSAIPPSAVVIVMMGSTGSGKSSFIDSLAINQSLNIAKDCLEGVTQEVTPYLLGNAISGKGVPIVLVDTPGFSDSRLSEMRIVSMVQNWMRSVSLTEISTILYFDRITDLRMSGNRWKTMRIFKALIGRDVASRVMLVTTMWNLLWNDRQVANANRRLRNLERTYWKDFIQEGLVVEKFRYTPQSALCVINKCLNLPPAWLPFAFQKPIKSGKQPGYMKLLQDRLGECITTAQERLCTIDEEFKDKSVTNSWRVAKQLRRDEKALRRLLLQFYEELELVTEGDGHTNLLRVHTLPSSSGNTYVVVKTWFTPPIGSHIENTCEF